MGMENADWARWEDYLVLTMAKCREVLVLPDGEADAEPAEVDGEVVGRAPVRMTVLDEQIRVVMPDLH